MRITIKALGIITLFFFLSTLMAREVSLYGNFSGGALQGFTQTPQGGTNGTTSFHRPSFDELHIHHDKFYTLGATFFSDNYFLLFDYYNFTPKGNTVLSEALTTHGKFIPAGSAFAASLNYHLYTVGFGMPFKISHLEFLSWLEVNLLKYHYEFSAFPISSARNFNVTGVNFGLKCAYDFSDTLFGDVKISLPIPVTNLTVIGAEIGLNKTVVLNQHLCLIPRLGLGLLQLDYKDNQPIPNHMRYTNAPYISLGLVINIK